MARKRDKKGQFLKGPISKKKKGMKKSGPKGQRGDKSRLKMEDLNPDQGLVLMSQFLFATDNEAIEYLPFKRDKFYLHKKQVAHLVGSLALILQEQYFGTTMATGKKAMLKLSQLLSKGKLDFQKDTANNILDRVEKLISVPEEPGGITPPTQVNIFTRLQKEDKEFIEGEEV